MRLRRTDWRVKPITTLTIDIDELLANEWSSTEYNVPTAVPITAIQGQARIPGQSEVTKSKQDATSDADKRDAEDDG